MVRQMVQAIFLRLGEQPTVFYLYDPDHCTGYDPPDA